MSSPHHLKGDGTFSKRNSDIVRITNALRTSIDSFISRQVLAIQRMVKEVMCRNIMQCSSTGSTSSADIVSCCASNKLNSQFRGARFFGRF